MFSPLNVKLKSSRYYPLAVFLIYLLAGLAVLAFEVSPFVKLVLLATLLLALAVSRCLTVNQGISGFLWSAQTGEFSVYRKAGVKVRVPALGAIFRLRWLVLIRLVPEQGVAAQWLVLLPDMMSAEEWRRLQVLSRWLPPPA